MAYTNIARLAYLADRKFLALEEESYYRLDCGAHEKIRIPWFQVKPKESTLKSAVNFFALTALIFLILFGLTNAPAYSKILLSYLPAANKVATEHLNTMADNTLKPIERAEIQPENGIMPLNIWVASYEDRIQIPSLNVDAPLVMPKLGLDALKARDWPTLEDQIRSSLSEGVVYYPGTAEPGTKGNFFVTGHSSNYFWEISPYNTVFALLPKIAADADIYVTYKQNHYHYKVASKREVGPDDVSILKQGTAKEMTLMTCTPVGTTLRRLVVAAYLVED